jgi:anti-sigma-K factor RskA
MTPLVKRLTDVAIVMAISAGIAFAIIAAANSLAAKMTLWRSYNLWLSVITRPDIIATSLLAIMVTMAVITYQQRHGKR